MGCQCEQQVEEEPADNVITGFTPVQIEELAQHEHDRWFDERASQGWRYGQKRDNALKLHPSMVKWNDPDSEQQLSPDEKEKDLAAVRAIPKYLIAGDYVIVR